MYRIKQILFFILFVPGFAAAMSNDNQQPAAINADSALLNLKENTRIFTGHVKVTQGSTQLTANKLITYGSKQKKFSKLIALGNPATYQTIPKQGDAIFYASANKIEYFADTGKVILIGDGILHQGVNSFKASYITYDRKQGIITSKHEKNQRTTIIIQPNALPKS